MLYRMPVRRARRSEPILKQKRYAACLIALCMSGLRTCLLGLAAKTQTHGSQAVGAQMPTRNMQARRRCAAGECSCSRAVCAIAVVQDWRCRHLVVAGHMFSGITTTSTDMSVATALVERVRTQESKGRCLKMVGHKTHSQEANK